MNVQKCLILLMMCLKNGVTGDKHKDHIKVYVPEFIHHDHHVKVITIHHHHHKPKKEHHHHHHHHHPKPYIPLGHHYHHHQHKKAHTATKTSSKSHHKHHGHHYGHHGRLGHHGYGHQGYGHHHDPVPYTPGPSSYGDYGSYSPPTHSVSPHAPYAYDSGNYAFVPHSPSSAAFDGGIHTSIPGSPKVHGVTQVVKEVKVFDSFPGVISNIGTDDHGYEVSEFGNDGGNELNSVNSVQQNFPGTYDYIRGVSEQPSHDPFAELISQGAVDTNSHDPFAGAIAQPTVSQTEGETFTDITQSDPSVSTPFGHPSIQPSQEYPASFQELAGFDEQSTSFAGDDGDSTNFLSENIEKDTPVTFHREAGIQQTVKTGGVETVVY